MLTHWKSFKPFEDLLSFQNRIDRFFGERPHREEEKSSGAYSTGTWSPAADIFETKDEYVFKLDVPGLSRDDVNVEFENGVLSINGERKEEKEVKEENYHRIESYSGSFSRKFNLPKNADAKNIAATIKDGVLELRVAKAEEMKAKSIPIKVK
ncbi:MAG: Hsp20/alpha crystallin family protein [bacterium]|nr:Hsp20/alpha crystallin family protein [bacterium]